MLGFTAPPRPVVIEDTAPPTPSNVSAPSLSGSFFAGQALISDTGAWSGAPTAYEYKWQRNGVDIGDADNSYTISGSDDGGLIRCLVRAQNSAGWSGWVASNVLYALNLSLWLDAADAATIVHSSGAVSQWSDKSGNGHHLTQATSTRRPVTASRTINGINALTFDGTDDRLSRTGSFGFGSGDNILFSVSLLDVTGASRWIFHGGALYGIATGEGTPRQDASFSHSSALNKSLGAVSPVTARILGMQRAGTSQFLFDGETDYTGSSAVDMTASAIHVGSYNGTQAFFDGLIGEVIIAQRAWSGAERNQVAAYLYNKWGVAWSNR